MGIEGPFIPWDFGHLWSRDQCSMGWRTLGSKILPYRELYGIELVLYIERHRSEDRAEGYSSGVAGRYTMVNGIRTRVRGSR